MGLLVEAEVQVRRSWDAKRGLFYDVGAAVEARNGLVDNDCNRCIFLSRKNESIWAD